jgi:hypothetical protein
MRKDINYITIDGRGEHESFKDCVTQTLKTLKPNEGIHVIKDFEPFPMYKMMEAKGLDKYVEKVSDKEYHAYFFPPSDLKDIQMNKHLEVDNSKIKKMVDIKLDFLNNVITLDEAKKRMASAVDKVTAQEFAVSEQHLQSFGITDDMLAERMDEILKIYEGILVSTELSLPEGHPIRTYQDENAEITKLLNTMDEMLNKKFIKNQWLEIYDKLTQYNVHLSRKQNQLFSALEKKGFDKPSKVMWTLDNNIKSAISKSKSLLNDNKDNEFLELQKDIIEMIRDMIVKENEILFPTAVDLLTTEDFINMRIGDDEIGYCLIDNPPIFGNANSISENINIDNSELLKDLKEVLNKHGISTGSKENEVLNVSQGLLTLEQINLIFKHLPVDLSYTDENDIVKFYSDTKHRIFPRSPGVIGRQVQNCHPRESVHVVEKMIEAFKSGEHDSAEFWLEIDEKFIYIIYNAVRNENGNFKGVLEMMQDVTHIRSLTGSQRLLSWENDSKLKEIREETIKDNKLGITPDTKIGDLVKKHPYLKDYLISLSPKFEKLNNTILFKTMGSVATLSMISARGDLKVENLIDNLVSKILEKSNEN